MKRILQRRKHNDSKIRYQQKRSGDRYVKKRRNRLIAWKNSRRGFIYQPLNVKPHHLKTPPKLNFVDNTDEILDYFIVVEKWLKYSMPIMLDISDVTQMTPDTIAFWVSQVTNLKSYKAPVYGNAPKDEKTQKIFLESGFYKYVRSKFKDRSADGNLMHKESSYKVMTNIAASGTELTLNNGNYDEDETEAIYNIFIELMSNTHHHANLSDYGKTKWWLYVYSNQSTNTTSVCFLDLGVGIFKSIVVKNYVQQIKRKLGFTHNIDLVDDLIKGNIASRIDIDNEIRGKGLPQIFSYSALPIFKKFYMITNNVKVDLKNNLKQKLSNNFAGTFFYFEVCPLRNNIEHGN